MKFSKVRVQELCESRGVRPGLGVPNKPDGMCGPQTTLKRNFPLNYERDPEEGGGAGLS